jgi:hypothetical protein
MQFQLPPRIKGAETSGSVSSQLTLRRIEDQCWEGGGGNRRELKDVDLISHFHARILPTDCAVITILFAQEEYMPISTERHTKLSETSQEK